MSAPENIIIDKSHPQFPPDFDPSLISKVSGNERIEIRMMLPFSLRCNTCLATMSMGDKVTAKKEHIKEEAYNGARTFRFYFQCRNCSSEITLKTNPQEQVYECDIGASVIV